MLNVSAYFIEALALLGWSFVPFSYVVALLFRFLNLASLVIISASSHHSLVCLSALSEVISMIWFLDYLTALDGYFLVILMIYDGNGGGV